MNWKQQFSQAVDGLPALHGTKILVVDDDADSRALLTYLFEGCGATVIAVDSAQAAFAAVELQQPHILVSDIGLPNEDGYSLISRIRNLKADEGGQIPAIAVTGYTKELTELNNSPGGFQLHLTKPVDCDQLLTAVASLMKRETMFSG